MNEMFPEIFITGKIPLNRDERALCADALCGWACCMGGAKPPENFGIAMVEIGRRLGVSPTAESIEQYAINKGWL